MNQVVFKRIRVWKVILLNIVTLGIYSLVWLLARRNELPEDIKKKTPHWGWLIGFFAGTVSLSFFLYFAILAIPDSQRAAEVFVFISYVLEALVTIGLTWWIVRTVRAINTVIDLPLSTLFMILVAVFCAPALVVYEQYAINGSSPAGRLEKLLSPIVVISVVVGIIVYATLYLFYPINEQILDIRTDHASIRHDIDSLGQEFNSLDEVMKLSAEYDACTEKLTSDYPEPEITEEDYAMYNAAYEKCDEIYKKIQEQGR